MKTGKHYLILITSPSHSSYDVRYHCDIPDEFVFSPIATLKELAAAVKLGHLSDDQRQRYENVGASNPSHNINNNAAAGPRAEVVVVNQRTPCCPWFTCCY